MSTTTHTNPKLTDVQEHVTQVIYLRHPEIFTAILIIAICATVGFINPAFFQISTFFDLLRSSTVIGIFALGVLVVLAAGGIDVSFTAIAAFTMYGLTKLVFNYWPSAPIALILFFGAFSGICLGLLNGYLVHYLKAPSLIVTIGTQYLFRGILLTFIGATFFMNIPVSMDQFGRLELIEISIGTASQSQLTILPVFVLALLICSLLTWVILNRTLIGRAIYAIGGSLQIAERLGYNVKRVHLFVFGYSGFLAGLAGIIHVSSNRLANPFDLIGIELDVIAAVILGGARITGGTGTVIGTLLGVFLVILINNVLILAGVPSTWQKVIIGAFILIAGACFSLQREN
jgi:simple sugar transport system permease protein